MQTAEIRKLNYLETVEENYALELSAPRFLCAFIENVIVSSKNKILNNLITASMRSVDDRLKKYRTSKECINCVDFLKIKLHGTVCSYLHNRCLRIDMNIICTTTRIFANDTNSNRMKLKLIYSYT